MAAGQGRDFNRLLIIDDEPGIRRMMSLDLSADGYQVSVAEDGESGLDAFEFSRPDIVLTDIKMPGIDGLEVLRRIKESSPDTEVIVITGHGDMDSAIKSLQMAAGDFVTKPIRAEALEVALDRARERLVLKARLAEYTKGLEAKVAEAAAKLVQAERLAAVGQTVASLAHSIKNMLGGLRGGTYMVREGLTQKSDKILGDGLEMLERNVARVAEFVSNLLTLSKPRVPEEEPVDAALLAAEAMEMMGLRASQKEVTLVMGNLPGGEMISVERKAVLDALLNLISNAVDAASEVSGGRAEVDVEATGREVIFSVSDNGPGLSEEAEACVFEGFYSSKGSSGTGLGLMVTSKTAQEHGGRIEFDSRRGEGAVFRMVLPRSEAD